MQLGDVVVFKRKGLLAFFLAHTLWLFDKVFLKRDWDKWGWHTAVVSDIDDDEVWILEAAMPVSKETKLNLLSAFRVYSWLKSPVSERRWKGVIQKYTGKQYDWDAYISTLLTYPLAKIFKKSFTFADDEYHCQELVNEVFDAYGEELLEDWQPVVITEIMAKLTGK
jgi:hypothetical protein